MRHASRSSAADPSSEPALVSEGDENPLPPLDEDDFDHLVCEKCVLGPARSTIGRYVGSPGFAVLWNDGELSHSKQPAQKLDEAGSDDAKEVTDIRSHKRSREGTEAASSPKPTQDSESPPLSSDDASLDLEESGIKRMRASLSAHNDAQQHFTACSAPAEMNKLLSQWETSEKGQRDPPRMHVFLQDTWRDRLCPCEKVCA